VIRLSIAIVLIAAFASGFKIEWAGLPDAPKFIAVILGIPLLVGFYYGHIYWKPMRFFCWVFDHRWFFNISFPSLKSGEQYCVRCGKQEYRIDKDEWRS
jgi:hypothetical protein